MWPCTHPPEPTHQKTFRCTNLICLICSTVVHKVHHFHCHYNHSLPLGGEILQRKRVLTKDRERKGRTRRRRGGGWVKNILRSQNGVTWREGPKRAGIVCLSRQMKSHETRVALILIHRGITNMPALRAG